MRSMQQVGGNGVQLTGCVCCTTASPCRGFKALKQIVKLLFKLGRREEMMEAYRQVAAADHQALPAGTACMMTSLVPLLFRTVNNH